MHAGQPEDLQTTLLLSMCQMRLGKYQTVIELLEPVANRNPNDMAVGYLLGMALIRGDQPDRGQVYVDRILRNGDSAEARLLMGTAKLANRDFSGARDDLTQALAKNPALPEANAYLGLALLRTGDTAGAAKAFRKELEGDPNNFDANLQLGGLMHQEHRFVEARALLERALRIRPSDPGARYQLAVVNVAGGRMEEAKTALESLVKDAPGFTAAHVTLATVYYRMKRKEDGDRERAIVQRLNAEQQAKQPGAQAVQGK